jgi:CBS domain containing-hemolysin-like protein
MAEPGKKVAVYGAEFTVESVSRNRVQRIRVVKTETI